MNESRLLTAKEVAKLLNIRLKRVYEIKEQIPGFIVLGQNQHRWSEKKVREFIDGDSIVLKHENPAIIR